MKGQTNKHILGTKLQRVLRNSVTDAEHLLWRHLRRGQMAGFKFRRQHPYGDFILDFVCLEARLVIELDGGQHVEHSAADSYRTSFLERAGFQVLRFWNHEVFHDLDDVKEAICQALHTPPPSQPSP